MTSLTTIEQLDNNNPSLSPASANWGKVYQKYISINLSSDQLMKGAYDAYNLLTAGKLSDFQGKAINAINGLIANQNSLAKDLNNTVDNLDNFFSTTTGFIATGTILSAKHSLSFPSNDSGTLSKVYNLSDDVRIPFVDVDKTPGLLKFSDYDRFDKVAKLFNTSTSYVYSNCNLSFPASDDDTQNSTKYNLSTSVTIPLASGTTPGLIKGSDYSKFNKVTSLFNTESTSASSKYTLSFPSNDNGTKTSYDLSGDAFINFVTADNPGLLKGSDYSKFSKVSTKFTPSITTDSWITDSSYDVLSADSVFSPMEVLVFKINRLQSQVNKLLSVISGLFSEDSPYVLGAINVKSITFTSADVSKISLDNFGNSNYINSSIVKLS